MPPPERGVAASVVDLIATVTADPAAGTVSGPFVRFIAPPAPGGLLGELTPDDAVPAEVIEKLRRWTAAWIRNDASTLDELAGDADDRLLLPPSRAPEGWQLDESAPLEVIGARYLAEQGRWDLLVSFGVTPPILPDYAQEAARLAELGFKVPGSFATTVEVTVIEEGENRLPRIVGWGPVGLPSGERQQ